MTSSPTNIAGRAAGPNLFRDAVAQAAASAAKQPTDLGSTSGVSPPPIRIHLFAGTTDTVGQVVQAADLCALLTEAGPFPSKLECPMFSAGIFDGPIKNRIPFEFPLVVVEHDAGEVGVDQAAQLLEAAGIEAILFTTASHTAEHPRWRAVCRLAVPISPADYLEHVNALNGALGGCLARESADLSRRWFYGRVKGAAFHAVRVQGAPLDVAMAMGLDSDPLPMKTKSTRKHDTPFEPTQVEELTAEQLGDVRAALFHRKAGGAPALDPDNRETWIKVIQNLKRHGEPVREVAREWSALSAKHTHEEFDRKWRERGGERSDFRSIFTAVKEADPTWVNPLHVPTAEGFELVVDPTPTLADLPDVVSAPARAGDAVQLPAPFRGPMAAAVAAALEVAPKPQPALTTLAALIGMAACIPGHYRLPSGARMNLYGLAAAETGAGKDLPRNVARAIAHAGGAVEIGRPASGQGLEDSLIAGCPMICEIDEIGHVLKAVNDAKAPPHLVELTRTYLALYSASSNSYNCRVRANGKPGATSVPRVIENPCVSLLGFSTPEKLGEALGEGSVVDGLLGRMLFVMGDADVEQRRISRPFELPTDFNNYQARLEQGLAVGGDGRGEQIVVQYGQGVPERLDVLVREFSREVARSPFSKALRARSFEKVERVAGVLAVFDAPRAPVMTLEHVEWATALVRSSNAALERFAADFMHGGQVQADAHRVIGIIDRLVSGELAVQTSVQMALVRKGLAPRVSVLKSSKLDKRRFDDAVAHLIATGDVEAVEVKQENGRLVRALRRADES